jgi:hypothetical protein
MSDALRLLGSISIGDQVVQPEPPAPPVGPVAPVAPPANEDTPQNELARLEALRAEVQAARQVFHAELAAVAPILGDIFKEWPGATITGVVDGPPPPEGRTIVRSEPPPPEAVERRAHELLEQAELTLGVQVTDRVRALDYYRCRARAELSSVPSQAPRTLTPRV